MNYIPKKHNNKLTIHEIDRIIETYKRVNTIEKTAKILGHSKNTVNKYVKHLSVKDKRSCYNNTRVYKINPRSGEIIKIYKNGCQASKLSHISYSNINQCLNGWTNSAGGYCWCYEDKYENYKLPSVIRYSRERELDILLSLK